MQLQLFELRAMCSAGGCLLPWIFQLAMLAAATEFLDLSHNAGAGTAATSTFAALCRRRRRRRPFPAAAAMEPSAAVAEASPVCLMQPACALKSLRPDLMAPASQHCWEAWRPTGQVGRFAGFE